MKKFAFLCLVLVGLVSFAGAEGVVTIPSFNAQNQEVDLVVPFDPQRIAILDMAALDMLDTLGLSHRVVGSAQTALEYLQPIVTRPDVRPIGTIKEPNLEAIMDIEPDVIFIGGRLQQHYDTLSTIAPVIYLRTDTALGVAASVEKNLNIVATLFGLEEQANGMLSDYENRLETLRTLSEGKNAVIALVSGGGLSVLGPDGRASLIGREAGFNNIGAEESATATHGNEASFEFVVSKNPDYLFILDRDAAIATKGAKLAQEIVENDLIRTTDAYQNGRIVYLAHPDVWYTAEGGPTALSIMIEDVFQGLQQG